MIQKRSKSALAKALDQRQTKDASKPDGSFSMESENEFSEDKEENDSDVEENIFETLEDTGINKKDTTLDASNINYVFDGSYLLHRVVWDKASIYKGIIHLYQKYVNAHYGKCTIVFDRCVPVPSTKNYKHTRRLMKSTIAPDMSVELENTFTAVNQKEFFSNSQNKQKFIDLLAVQLEAYQHTVVKCTGYIFHY